MNSKEKRQAELKVKLDKFAHLFMIAKELSLMKVKSWPQRFVFSIIETTIGSSAGRVKVKVISFKVSPGAITVTRGLETLI